MEERPHPCPSLPARKKSKDAPALPGKAPSSKRERKKGKVTLSEAAQQRASLPERLCCQPAPVTSPNATSPQELASLLLLPSISPSSKCQPHPVSVCSWEQGRGSNVLQKPAAKIADPILSWGGQPRSLGSILCVPREGHGGPLWSHHQERRQRDQSLIPMRWTERARPSEIPVRWMEPELAALHPGPSASSLWGIKPGVTLWVKHSPRGPWESCVAPTQLQHTADLIPRRDKIHQAPNRSRFGHCSKNCR